MKKSASYSNSFPTQDWVRETIPRLILMDDAFMRVVLKDMKYKTGHKGQAPYAHAIILE